MFKGLLSSLSSAISGNDNNNNDGNDAGGGGGGMKYEKEMRQLMSMGFEQSPATYAINESNGDVMAAIAMLTSASSATASSASMATPSPSASMSAQAAMKRVEQQHQRKQPQPRQQPTTSSATVDDVGDRIDALAKKIAPYPEAVDMLIYVFETILTNPGDDKYRSIKTTKPSYVSSIGSCSKHAEELLGAVGFHKSGEYMSLPTTKRKGEESLLWTAKTALESQRETAVYVNNKDRIMLLKVMAESRAMASAEETERRKELKKKIPNEPEEGAAGTTRITVFLGEKDVLKRRFASDDSLMQVVNWIGSEYSSVLPIKLQTGTTCELVDVTLFPSKTIDVAKDAKRNLQALGLWPSAELRVRVSEMQSS